MKWMLTAVLFVLIAAPLVAAERFGWRGDGTGQFPNSQPPLTWSKTSNIVWQASLPGAGFNSPAYSDKRLFVTAEPGHVLCFDATTGKELWRGTADYAAALGTDQAQEIAATYEQLESEKRAARAPFEQQRKEDPTLKEPEELREQIAEIDRRRSEYEKRFPTERRGGTGNAAPSPVTDGARVFVAFGTGVVAGFTTDGERLWTRHIEPSPLGFGHSATPVLAADHVIVHVRDLVALDPQTGAEKWRTALPAKHGSPVVTKVGDEEVVITPCGAIVKAADGKVLAEKLFDLSENSPLVQDGVIYAHEVGQIKALRLPDELSDQLECEVLWETKAKGEQRMASAALHDGRLYAGSRQGILDVTDAKTGKRLYQKRLQVGEMFSSVAIAGDRIFISGTEGKTVVLRPSAKYDEVALNELERFSSSPIFVGRRIYVRTDNRLYCLGPTEESFISTDEKEVP